MTRSVKSDARETPSWQRHLPGQPDGSVATGCRLARSVLGACVVVALLSICMTVSATARSLSPRQQVRQAWDRFDAAYVHRAAASLCPLLAPAAQKELEAQVGRDRCDAAAARWFTTVQYDRPAAAHARLLQVYVLGTHAQTYDTNPDSPASQWIETRGHWKLASFLVLG